MSKSLTYKEKYILDNIPINDLYREGFLKSKDLKHVEERVCRRLGLKNIFMYSFIGCDKHFTVKADVKTFSEN
jgi:hypothetical protein